MTPSSPTCIAEHPSSTAASVVKDKASSSCSSSAVNSSSRSPTLTTAQDWYDQGERVWYDPVAKQIVSSPADSTTTSSSDGCLLRQVFCRVVQPQEEQPEEPLSPTQQQRQRQQKQHRQRWMTFLPGNPEGSYGFHQVEEALSSGRGGDGGDAAAADKRDRCDTDSTEMSLEESIAAVDVDASIERAYDRQNTRETPNNSYDEHDDDVEEEDDEETSTNSSELSRLYLDYLGQGDSDTLNANHPASSSCSSSSSSSHDELHHHESTHTTASHHHHHQDNSPTKQRADLVEAHWHAHHIQRTVVVSVGDASSLVVMELLQRQRARLAAGTPFPKIMHVLAVNGRYVAKTRHTSQLPTVTQLLRSDRVGPSLAAKAQRSDFTLGQCLQPYLKGLASHISHSKSTNKQQHVRHVRQQVMDVVRRHNGATRSLQDMARTVDDHLQDAHKYRWHLPRLFHLFGLNQGITFQLATTHRQALRQTQLVRESLARDYELDPQDCCPGIRYDDWTTSHASANVSSTAFLLGSSREQLQPLLEAIHRLANEEIPLSDNSHHHHHRTLDASTMMSSSRRMVSFEEDHHHHPLLEEEHDDDEEEDSWQVSESDLAQLAALEEAGDHESQDSRLETEIAFDTADLFLLDDVDYAWAL